MLLLKFNRGWALAQLLQMNNPSIGFSQNLSIQNSQSIFPQSSVVIRVICG